MRQCQNLITVLLTSMQILVRVAKVQVAAIPILMTQITQEIMKYTQIVRIGNQIIIIIGEFAHINLDELKK
jgi:hypothetical protein